MKKLKLLTSLSTLGLVATSVPLVVTSCSDKEDDVIPESVEWLFQPPEITASAGHKLQSDNFQWNLLDKDGNKINPSDYKVEYSEVICSPTLPTDVSCYVEKKQDQAYLVLDATKYNQDPKINTTGQFTLKIFNKDTGDILVQSTIQFKVTVIPYANEITIKDDATYKLPESINPNVFCATFNTSTSKYEVTFIDTAGNEHTENTEDITSITLTDVDKTITQLGNNFLLGASITEFDYYATLNNIVTVGDYFLSGSKITSFSLEWAQKIKRFGNYFLANANDLESVYFYLSISLSQFGDYAFSSCESLKSLQMKELSKFSNFGNDFASGCTKLNEVILWNVDNVFNETKIGNNFFKGCTSLVKLDLRSFSFTRSIGTGFMDGCSALEQLGLPMPYVPYKNFDNPIPTLGGWGNNVGTTNLKIYIDNRTDYKTADVWKNKSDQMIEGLIPSNIK